MRRPVYIFAGGGSGGHLYPGLAVAAELAKVQPDAAIVFACADRQIDRKILDPTQYAIVPQPVRPLPRGPRGWWSFLRAWSASAAQARDIVCDLKPAAVLGLGGFAAGPVVKRAARAGVPAAILNPDAVPGRANRYLSTMVEAVFAQFESTRQCLPTAARAAFRHVGCPIRTELLYGDRAEAMRHFGLMEGRRTLLVFGGSLLASALTDAVCEVAGDLEALADQWQVLYVCGADRAEKVRGVHRGGKVHAVVLPYCDRMELAYAAADLALCRAGASTVAELAATGTPAVVLPYPHHKDDHQRLNAAGLANAGAAVITDDAKDAAVNAAALREKMLPIMRDPSRLEQMRQAARAFGKPCAATEVARWMAGR